MDKLSGHIKANAIHYHSYLERETTVLLSLLQ